MFPNFTSIWPLDINVTARCYRNIGIFTNFHGRICEYGIILGFSHDVNGSGWLKEERELIKSAFSHVRGVCQSLNQCSLNITKILTSIQSARNKTGKPLTEFMAYIRNISGDYQINITANRTNHFRIFRTANDNNKHDDSDGKWRDEEKINKQTEQAPVHTE